MCLSVSERALLNPRSLPSQQKEWGEKRAAKTVVKIF